MLARHLRFALLGGLIGLVAAVTPGCQKKCGADTCATGCCTDKNECITSVGNSQCGLNGATCSACATDQTCTDGVCMATMNNTDAGEIDAGPPPCRSDFDCEGGKICNTVEGTCVMGQTCTQDFQCQSLDPQDRCYRYGQQCTCDTSATGGNVCRLRKGPCEECTADLECGSDVIIFGPPDGIGAGRCKALPGDMSGKKYCLYQRVGQCACGTIDDGTGFCKPQSNSCDQVGCNVDKDCPSGAVCSVNNPDAGVASCGGVCVPRCRWDFNLRDNVAPGCPPGQTCWVDSQNLNPESIYYGSGRCKPACSDNMDCQQSAGNPFGGANLACRPELLLDGTESAKRCRANGACMDNAECPELMDAGPYLGYCDRGSFVCRNDCRPGTDPVSGNPYKDCRPPFSCAVDAGINFCRLETCVEQGGAGIACAQGQYCCGDDKNFDGIADPCPPLNQQDPAGCYNAPVPPFCTTCGAVPLTGNMLTLGDFIQADTDCRRAMIPSWATCRDGGLSPNCSPLQVRCVYAGDRAMQGDGINVCMWPSVNDVGSVNLRYGPTPKTQIACPTNYSVQAIRPAPNPSEQNYCDTNLDCSKLIDGGVSDAGVCEPDPTLRLMDGGFAKSCRCDAKSLEAQCPQYIEEGTDQMGATVQRVVQSVCRDAVAGSRSYCIETLYCSPPRGSVYKATTEFGCGL
ncbi:MAG: hypothetical protein JNM17_39920 [Archangium sp.]|nr:hypothetical protein [Archangium sp.]